jgi:type I restriction enzyme S subunit
MSISRYENYKNSGLPWLREIPSHWDIIQSRRLFALRKEKAKENDRQLTASQKHGVIYQDEYIALEGQQVVQVLTGADILKHVEPNDFVISMRSFQGGIEWCGQRGCISSAYVMLIPSDSINVKFFSYLFKCKPYIQALQSTSNLVRDGQALRYENFTLIDLPVIPYSEQQIIAAFLDSETAKIDALISEQNRLIELLKEKRRGVITNAVTRGLNRATPSKDSGIQWLGQVPKDWEVTSFRRVARIEEGQVSPTDELYSDWILIAPNHIESGTGRVLSLETAAEQAAISGKYRVRAGEVIYSKIRPALNKVCVSDIDCLCSADMYPIRPVNGLMAPFLLYLMLSQPFVNLMVDESMRVAMPKVNRETLYACRVAIPPLRQQEAIVSYIRVATERYDALTAQANLAIELLQERRSALISAAVTGKIDVRGLVGVHPEEVAAE